MRYILLASALVAFAPVALAQTTTGTKPPMAAKPAMSAPTEPMPTGYTVQPANPNNCGTPDEPKPCSGTTMAHKMAAPAKKPSS
jgi:hypothetical protein